MPANDILIIEDEETVAWGLRRGLERAGWRVAVAATAEAGLAKARVHTPAAIFLDVRLPGMDGLVALEQFRRVLPDTAVIVMTAYGDLTTAVRAVAGGAFEYLPKPFDLDQAIDAAARAARCGELELKSESFDTVKEPALVGRSPAMQAVFKRIALVAPQNTSVLITGESGTGKELVARAIHRHSRRSDRPFLPVHVAALNPNLVESELFGHEKGAFTGASQARPGLFALADGGTLFLDELAEIPPSVQVKLLRVLEQGECLPVGGHQPQRFDVRFLAATNRDLPAAIAAGKFRADLYYRLNVFPIHLPPLRERRDDIDLLADFFLRDLAPGSRLTETARASLVKRPWPGNVRELRNALEHAVIVARGGPLLPEHLPTAPTAPPADNLAAAVRAWLATQNNTGRLHADLVAAVERTLLSEMIAAVGGNRWEAARRLGLNRSTVRRKLAAYGLANDYPPDPACESRP